MGEGKMDNGVDNIHTRWCQTSRYCFFDASTKKTPLHPEVFVLVSGVFVLFF